MANTLHLELSASRQCDVHVPGFDVVFGLNKSFIPPKKSFLGGWVLGAPGGGGGPSASGSLNMSLKNLPTFWMPVLTVSFIFSTVTLILSRIEVQASVALAPVSFAHRSLNVSPLLLRELPDGLKMDKITWWNHRGNGLLFSFDSWNEKYRYSGPDSCCVTFKSTTFALVSLMFVAGTAANSFSGTQIETWARRRTKEKWNSKPILLVVSKLTA